VLIVSDSKDFIDAYKLHNTGKGCTVIDRPQWKPEAGTGAFFVKGSGMDGVVSETACAPPEELQFAADAVIDMMCLGACDVFLASAHSMFTYPPAVWAKLNGNKARQMGKQRRDHENDHSACALCEFN